MIEAVFEDLKVKQRVFAEVEAVASETAVLLTNAPRRCRSPRMVENLQHPERVVGFHLQPGRVMPLLDRPRQRH